MIVVDTNVIASLFLETSCSGEAEAAFRVDSEWVAPLLWRSEFRNILATRMRTGDLDLEVALEVIKLAETMMEGHEYDLPSAVVLRLAEGSGCTAYDMEFVALSQELGVPLVTLDKQILRSFPAVSIPLKEFAAGGEAE